MLRQITLKEYDSSAPTPLTIEERRSLESVKADIGITPASDIDGEYILRPNATVGAFEIEGLSVLIQPKIGIPQLLSLACYAIGAYRPHDASEFDYEENVSLPDALALALARAARQAFSRGVLHGYRKREEALQTVRGRIRLADQVRRRYGIAPPIEVRYQEFTDDVLENQLVKAAAHRLGSLRLRSPQARRGLGWIAGTLDNVSFVDFNPRDVPPVTFGRLNDHYAGLVALSRLILRHGAFESGRGEVRAAGFLMDMNVVFQEFLATALKEVLRGVNGDLRTDKELKGRINLDVGEQIPLRPDLTWWRGGQCAWVGDAKYKNLSGPDSSGRKTPATDLYQMLAYTTALNLTSGTLIYAKGEAEPRNYTVKHAEKSLEVVALDLELPLAHVLQHVQKIADGLKALPT